ncbi:potassium voltage-gated channel subfamily S member 3-like [Acipenser ruthenus]|uniref:potassium voltage-gated channel subfamily S member 3-like n=1 Tax=Acipenser ruthenus TaxID=7906 RepID=UPI00145A534D|nr:potassium voltage-gated channel subfamily S member 3-like [Acipenser ruthenus]
MVHGQFYQAFEQDNAFLKVNIGGLKKKVSQSILLEYPHSRLGKLLCCKTLEARIELCDDYDFENDEFYFDRSPVMFRYILNFYSTGKLHAIEGVCARSFALETEYWGISDAAIHSCCSYNFHMSQANAEDRDGDSDDLSMVGQEEVSPIHNQEEFTNLLYGSYRRQLWLLLENPAYSLASKVITAFSLTAILVSIIIMGVNSLPEFRNEEDAGLRSVETTCIIFFTLEFLARMMVTPSQKRFFLNPLNIIDLISFTPFYMTLVVESIEENNTSLKNIGKVVQVLRLLRIFRILKLARHSHGLKALGTTFRHSYQEIGDLVVFMAVGIAIFGALIYSTEKEEQEAGLSSIPMGWWWATVSMTTVGFGDTYPVTIVGKLVGGLCIIFGLLMVTLPVTIIFNRFSKCYRREQAIDATLWSQELKKTSTVNIRDVYAKRLHSFMRIKASALKETSSPNN